MINVGQWRIYCAVMIGLLSGAANVWIAAPVFASVTPEIYITSATIKGQTVFTPGGEVSGVIHVQNNEPYLAGDTRFAYYFLSRGTHQKIIDYRQGDAFILAPHEERDLHFSVWLPFKLPAGPLNLRIGIENSRGNLIAWVDQAIRISVGEGPFYYIDYNDKTDTGGIVDIGMVPYVNVKIEEQAVGVKPSVPALVMRVTTYRSGIKWDSREQELGKITCPSIISIPLPAFDVRDNTAADVRIYNRGSGDPYSNIIRFFLAGPKHAEEERPYIIRYDRQYHLCRRR